MNGLELFYEGYCQALRRDAQSVAGYKRNWAMVVGRMIFPEIEDPEIAARRLDDKLNPNRRERLSDEQERKIMREAARINGFSHTIAFICDDTGFKRPERIEAKVEVERLVGVIQNATETMQRVCAELERIKQLQEKPAAAPLTVVTK
jgi:hypothetical protein